MDEVPAWDVTVTYMADTTCPNKGVLLLNHYSGDGEGKSGCKPSVPLRKVTIYGHVQEALVPPEVV